MFPTLNQAEAQLIELQTESSGMRTADVLPAVIIISIVIIGVLVSAGLMIYKRQRRVIKREEEALAERSAELARVREKAETAEKRAAGLDKTLTERDAEAESLTEKLRDSRRIADEYANMVIEYCGKNISNVQNHYSTLRKLAEQGNIKGILKKLDSSDASTEAMKTFYSKLDDTIINIYPSFVESVNKLLNDDSQIEIKAGERLSTELRMLALIRMGITDSERISQFLKCSLSTIYTYRSKLKRRAKNPETFETDIEAIGRTKKINLWTNSQARTSGRSNAGA